ncbi:MAG: family 10 glycosylhydrolase [Ferruginibacter sp.]|nr:family 10 glycosylhydrolase [Ferruginibacter sp.]
MRYILPILFSIGTMQMLNINAQTPPKREMRGAWIATHSNIDWPSVGSTTAQEQSTFIQRVTEHKTTGMNAIFVQVRSQCDALYPNPYEPWSAVLTGIQGVAPSPLYDPLAFMINETKSRGMEFHAWFNPYRAMASFTPASYAALDASHVAKAHPTWIMDVTTTASGAKQKLLNPGAPEVLEHIIQVVMHVVRNYDVDGIHFDDYFYTNPALTTYNDDSVYAIHNRGIANRGDWRRSNVDTLVKRLNDSIKTVKPWVKFGISPTGVWMSSPADAAGSNTSAGATQHKKDLFANSRLWQQQGWVDYLAPQVYWYIGQTGTDYNILATWWNNNNFGRHIYMGQAGYKVGDALQNAAFATDLTQIPRQVRLDRSLSNISGQIVYNTNSLRNNPLGFRDSLQLNFYNKPALQPTMLWKDNVVPATATSLTAVQLGNNTIQLNWVKPATAINEMDKVKQFVIYKNINTAPVITNANHILTITATDIETFIDADVLPNVIYNYYVTSIDRLNNESVVSNIATVNAVVLPLTVLHFNAEKTINNNVQLTWETANEINTNYIEVERALNDNNFKKIITLQANTGSLSYDYKTTDFNVVENGTYYYRLKMVDKNGQYAYSEIKKVVLHFENELLTAYPNPTIKGDKLKLIWPNTNGNIAYSIIDIKGKVVMVNNVLFTAGVGNILISNAITPGTYVLQCYKNDKINTLKIIIQ